MTGLAPERTVLARRRTALAVAATALIAARAVQSHALAVAATAVVAGLAVVLLIGRSGRLPRHVALVVVLAILAGAVAITAILGRG